MTILVSMASSRSLLSKYLENYTAETPISDSLGPDSRGMHER